MIVIYVVEGSGGLVKVGHTRELEVRLKALARDFKVHNETIIRVDSMPSSRWFLKDERNAVERLASRFTVTQGREWFRGVTFDIALHEVSISIAENKQEIARWDEFNAIKQAKIDRMIERRRYRTETPVRVIEWTKTALAAID